MVLFPSLSLPPSLSPPVSGIWTGRHINRNIVFFPFSDDNADPALEGFTRFWSFVIILQVHTRLSIIP